MAEELRLKRLEDKVAGLEVSTAHGFGQVQAGLQSLRELVRSTIDRPAPPPPLYLVLLAAATFGLAIVTLLLVVVQLVT